MSDVQKLADRYVAVWNETDDAARRKQIAELWAPDGEHYVRTLEVRGYDALVDRVTTSHQKNVRDNGYVFRPVKNAQALQDVVFFNWEMFPAKDTKVIAAAGVIFLIVDKQERILRDYQFITA